MMWSSARLSTDEYPPNVTGVKNTQRSACSARSATSCPASLCTHSPGVVVQQPKQPVQRRERGVALVGAPVHEQRSPALHLAHVVSLVTAWSCAAAPERGPAGRRSSVAIVSSHQAMYAALMCCPQLTVVRQ